MQPHEVCFIDSSAVHSYLSEWGLSEVSDLRKEGESMYLAHWGLQCAPFENVPDPAFYMPSSQHEEGLSRLLYAVKERKGAVMLLGDVGCGKTLLSRELLGHLKSSDYDVALITNPALPGLQFLKEILYQFGIANIGRSKQALLHQLNDHLLKNDTNGVGSVVLVDEAQAITGSQTLEELRLLLNYQRNDRFLLTLILLGQPEFRVTLNSIPQLAQRIGIQYQITALSADETARYITHRVQAAGGREELFAPSALPLLYSSSKGIPRLINNLCDLCLLSGYLSRCSQIDAVVVEQSTRRDQYATIA